MLSFPPSVRIFVATFPVDMRKGIDGLYGLACGALRLSPLAGHVLVAFNRNRDHVKILWFDHGGFAVLQNQLASHCTSSGSRLHVTAVEPSRALCERIPAAGGGRGRSWTGRLVEVGVLLRQ